MKTKLSPVKISLLLILLLTLWVVSGVFANDEVVQEGKATELPKVKVVELHAKKIFDNISLRGESKASREVSLRIEVAGKVEKIIANDGDILKEGQSIIQMDSRARYENLRSAKAASEEKRTYYDAAKRLHDKGLQSEVGLSKARADYEMAKSNVKDMQLEVQNITLKAPFDGRLEKIQVEVGQYLQVGDRIASFVDYDPFEVSISVPEVQVSQLKIGQEIPVKLANGKEYVGKLKYISSVANSGTRTYDADIIVENSSEDFFDGMTAEVKIPLQEVLAHQISPAYFSLSTDGKIGVKIMAEGGVAKFVEVNILRSSDDGVWVSGLPDTVKVIATGHEYVEDGQKVEAVE